MYGKHLPNIAYQRKLASYGIGETKSQTIIQYMKMFWFSLKMRKCDLKCKSFSLFVVKWLLQIILYKSASNYTFVILSAF